MATCVYDTDNDIDITKIPIIDLRSFCQDEIRCVAQLSGDCSDERLHDIVNVAIDKSLFNESLGSRRQTYARDRIPRRAQHLPDTDAHSKPRLLGSPENQTSPGEQIQRSSSTDSKEKRSYRENQDLISRICRQMQKPLLAEGDSSFNVFKDNEAAAVAGNQARAKHNAKENAVFPAFKHFRTTIIAGGQLISVIEPRRNETHGQKRRHQSRTTQAEGQVVNQGSIVELEAAAGATTGVKKPKVDNGREDSIRLKGIARGNLTAGQEAAAKGSLSKENSPESSERLSKKMKTKEEARRRATVGSQTELLVPVSLKQVRLSSPGNGDYPKVRLQDRASQTQKPVDFKLMDAEGFPHGWKVCVALKKRRTGMSAKIIKFVSPDGQEWFSQKEALRHADSVVGINGSTQIRSGSKASKLALAYIGGPNGHKTDASKVLKARSAASIVRLNKNHAPGHAVCTTCGKAFTTQYSLRRHSSSQGHGADQASGVAVEHNPYRKVKGVQFSSKNDLKLRQQHGLTNLGKANSDAQREAGSALEEKVGTMEGNVADSNMETYKCKNCEKLFNSRRKYLTHLRVHSLRCSHGGKVRGFECRQCNLRFKRRKQYVDHLNTHSRKGKKKLGKPSSRKTGRPVGRPPVKVMGKPDNSLPKSKRAGRSSAASAEEKISFPESKLNLKRKYTRKSSKREFLCDKCGAAFSHQIAYISHQSVHSKKESKKTHEQEDHSTQERFREEGFDAQGTVENASTFPCQVCSKVFNEYFRYAGHLNVHSRKRKMAYHKTPSVASREKQNFSSGAAVNHDNDDGNSFCSQESLTSVLRKLLADTTGTCLPGLPAELLFARNVDTFELSKEKKPNEKKKTPVGSYQGDGVCSTSQADISQGDSIKEVSRRTGDIQFPLDNKIKLGWTAGGCSICGNIGADSAKPVVCNWCEREFHQSCLNQHCLVMLASWVCPSCRTASRSVQK